MESLLKRVERVSLGDIRAYPDNPRIGDIGALRESLKANKQFNPLVVQRSTGYILAGNHTYAAAKSLGWEEIDVVYIDVDDSSAKRIVLASNRISDLGGYNDPLLANLLQDLMDEDVMLLDGTGYGEDDVNDLLNSTLTDIEIDTEVSDEERDTARAAIDRLFPVTTEQEASFTQEGDLHPSLQAEKDAALNEDQLVTETNVLSGTETEVDVPTPPPVEEFVLFRFGDIRAKVPKAEFDSWRAGSDESDPFVLACDYLKSMGFGDEAIKPFEMDGPETWHS